MLYLCSINDTLYESEKGYTVSINRLGNVNVSKKGGLLSYNYINVFQFETALMFRECHVFQAKDFKDKFNIGGQDYGFDR